SYHQLRFIPLTNVTDVMLQNVMLNEKTEKLSIEILLEYVRSSCEEQEKRIQSTGAATTVKKKRKKKKNSTDGGSRIFQEWCLATSNRGGTNQLLMSAHNWVQTIAQVLDKLELQQQQHTSPSPSGDLATSGGFFNSSRILT